MIVEYFEKERKEFEELFSNEVMEKAKEKISEELEEIKEVEKKLTTQKDKEEYYKLFLIELLSDAEDEILEEREIRKASEKYLKEKGEKKTLHNEEKDCWEIIHKPNKLWGKGEANKTK